MDEKTKAALKENGCSDQDIETIQAAERIAKFFGWKNNGYLPGATFHNSEGRYFCFETNALVLEIDEKLKEFYSNGEQ